MSEFSLNTSAPFFKWNLRAGWMTLFFRALADLVLADEITVIPAGLQACWYDAAPALPAGQALLDWLNRYRTRVLQEDRPQSQRQTAMQQVNPLYVLRNWLAQQAIDEAEQGELGKLHELEEVLQQPYHQQAGKDHLAQKRPEWARQRAGCSMLSCSS